MWYDDPFLLFRTVLFVALTAYTTVGIVESAVRVIKLLRGDDPRQRLLRTYLPYLLVTLRLKPLRSELIQIAFWCGVLLLIWWLHP